MANQGSPWAVDGEDISEDITVPNMVPPISVVRRRRSNPDAVTLPSIETPAIVILSRARLALVCAAVAAAGAATTVLVSALLGAW